MAHEETAEGDECGWNISKPVQPSGENQVAEMSVREKEYQEYDRKGGQWFRSFFQRFL